MCRRLLQEFGVEIGSHVVALGGVTAARPASLPVPLDEAALSVARGDAVEREAGTGRGCHGRR